MNDSKRKTALLLLQLAVLSKLELQDKNNILQSSLHVRLERGPGQSQEEGEGDQRGKRDKGPPLCFKVSDFSWPFFWLFPELPGSTSDSPKNH